MDRALATYRGHHAQLLCAVCRAEAPSTCLHCSRPVCAEHDTCRACQSPERPAASSTAADAPWKAALGLLGVVLAVGLAAFVWAAVPGDQALLVLGIIVAPFAPLLSSVAPAWLEK